MVLVLNQAGISVFRSLYDFAGRGFKSVRCSGKGQFGSARFFPESSPSWSLIRASHEQYSDLHRRFT